MLATVLLGIGLGVSQPAPPQLDPEFKGTQFERYTTEDKFERKITFYVSRGDASSNVPVLLLIQGSGAQSIWTVEGEKIYGGLQNLAHSLAEGKFRVVSVEKPGAVFGQPTKQPGSAMDASDEFKQEHTLERWVEANRAALSAARELPGLASNKVCVMGHSEGGLVAAKLAAENSWVTHAVSMAGGGPSQLYDFTTFMKAEEVFNVWKDVQADPMSSTKMLWGHPYRRWSTFCETSPMEQFARFSGRIYVVQGTADKAVAPSGADIMVADLIGRNKDVTYVKVEGGDHGFQVPDKPESGMKSEIQKAINWFLAE